MRYWFTRPDAPIAGTWVKRFDPRYWTVDFPRGTVASVVTGDDPHSMTVTAEMARKGDLVGLIYESADRLSHPAHAYRTGVDYSGCTLSFRWQSSGVMPLDAANGPTLTIEGKDAAGNPRSWYVRLWNYAQGSSTDAVITLDFDAMDGGFGLPADADGVNPSAIDRLFISIVAPDYAEGSAELRAAPAKATVTISGLACDGHASVLRINDAMVPEHDLRIATAYDDMYNLTPERIVEAVERLGYRGVINHYIGMSHYFALDGAGLVDASRPMNDAALAWHRAFAEAAKVRGYDVIWSLSYEILDQFCPDAWKQRDYHGASAATGYDPPSTLVSPANEDAIAFLRSVGEQFVDIAVEAGLQPQVQVGEPWWWVTASGGLSLYDDAAKAALGGAPVEIADVRAAMTTAQTELLDAAGALLAASTAEIANAAKAKAADTRTLLLAYLPVVLDPAAPELARANLPVGWAKPAFDVLQLEDYDWVTSGRSNLRAFAYSEVQARLGYSAGEQHYLSGFVANAAERGQWREVIDAALEARRRGCAEVFIWALPQVLRDGLTIFGTEAAVAPFDDLSFPIEIGAQASVAPSYSTSIVTTASGYESRNANWQQARLKFDAGPGVRGDSELETLIAFFRARRGPAVGFRFRDPYDFSSNGMTATPSASDQAIGFGDGATARFELVKAYGGGETRRITRPVAGTVRVAIDGTELASGWTLAPLGVIELSEAPAVGATVTAGFLFDVPVRFAEDQIEVNRATFLAGEAPSVPLVEVREG
ncbi:DUF2460 domain-containing protein [Sphingomonas sp.]|uniref:DUF2460 domain-containing protein n=1 Tax=Sphingomonas sp. TaxID=28214 RepID=UPI0025E3575C|nr:DUF2460 domain-containing protein [Sphingomonas sp.]MBV9529256.1 DUF2460 domain-containing protein [Sphingomonas sp.]